MKKLYLLSLMLVGSISLFTSCVDADYYDLYEDEEELLSPRSKKGKDTPDFTDYPQMSSEWEAAECVAICYSNIYGVTDKATCRYNVIMAEYGKYKEKYIKKYFQKVQSGGVHATAADKLFGTTRWDGRSVAAHYASLYGGETGLIIEPKLAVWGPGQRHIAKVDYMIIESISGGYKLTVYIVDQDPTPHERYSVILDNNRQLVSQDFEDFLKCK